MATQEVIQRQFQDSEIEIIQKDSLAWITAEDIAKGLGHVNHTSLMRTYSRNKDEIESHTDFDGRNDKDKLFNQHGVFALIDHSRTQQSQDFKTWLIQEVASMNIPQTQPVIQPKTQKVLSYGKVAPTFTPIDTTLIERNDHDLILNLAILVREHVLFSGPPGTAKSLQAKLYFQNFIAETFSVQLSKFSAEEVLFGPLNIPKLRDGIIDYLYENSILTSDFAFIDEIFDASDVLLRSLLGVLNERHFEKGSFRLDIPLKTAVATANYVRSNEITEAVIDRFLFQYPVEPIQNKEDVLDFIMPVVNPTIELEHLEQYQQEASEVYCPHDVRKTYVSLCEEFNFTDRRIVNGLKVLKAHAWLKGRKKVLNDDLIVLTFMIGLGKNQILSAKEKIEQIIGKNRKREQQLDRLKGIELLWDLCQNEKTSKVHLKKEKEAIKLLKEFIAMDETIEEKRDSLLFDCQEHFEENRAKYIKKLNIQELL